MVRPSVFALTSVVLAVACSSSTDGTPSPPVTVKPTRPAPTPLAALSGAPTTAERVLVAATQRQSYKDGPNPSRYDALFDYERRGFGELAVQAGQPYATRVIDGSTPPPAGANAKRVVRFATLADLQLADDESPTRLAQYDSAAATASAARPQDAYLCRMTNAAVRTINALHAKDPLAFTLLGGDNADSAQTNELEWALGILSGAPQVKCDSGDDDDLVSGPDDDGKDPFVAAGLAMPWKWVTGNHDVLVQGTFRIDDGSRADVVADTANGGTRNYGEGGAIETGSVVIPDPKRALLSRAELMARVAGDRDGHGLGEAQKASGRATYTFDVPGTRIRFLVIDTAHEMGGADGVIRQAEVDRAIRPALDKAMSDGAWVILASHHAATSLSLDGGAPGFKESDALSTEQWVAFVGQYPNVLFSMVGHSHENRVRPRAPAAGHAWWEVMTAAIADFPHQFRLVEIYDQDNGWIMMRTAAVDLSVEGDPVAEEGRRRGVIDLTSGWLPSDGTGTAQDRNVELWIKKP